MFEYSAPEIPDIRVDVFNVIGETKPRLEIFNVPWYTFMNSVWRALRAIRSGIKVVSQEDLGAMAARIVRQGTNQVGLLVYVPVYNHTLQWTGAGWDWAPGDLGSGYYVTREATSPALRDGWQAADGSAYNTLKSDGTIVSVTTTVIANGFYRV